MPTLSPFLPFDSVETPISFATRLAAFHTGGRLVPFLHDMGVRPGALSLGEPEAVRHLCSLVGVDSLPALRNTSQAIAKRRYLLRGEEITAEFFSSPNTVFCPACLAEDDATTDGAFSARRGRLLWTLRAVRTCPHHQIALVHRAKERWDDQFRELAIRVPERGNSLLQLVEQCERRTVSPLQDYVVGRLDGRAGPDWLDGQSLEQAVRATDMLGVLLVFGPQAKLIEIDEAGWDRAGRIGYAYTAAGEAGIREALGQAQAAFPGKSKSGRGSGKPGRRKVFGRLYEWLSSTKERKEPGDIRRILREHIFDTMEVAAGEEILGGVLAKRRFHSIRSLAGEAGLDSRTLRNVLAVRGLVPADEAQGEHHVFDAETGRAVAATVRRSIHVISLPKALNCTRPQVDQLLAERILARVGGAPGIAPGRVQRAVDAAHVEELLSALLDSALSVQALSENLMPISKAAEKAKTPCHAIVHLVLGGYLDRVFRCAEIRGYAGLLVDPVEIQAKAHHVQAHLSAQDAFRTAHVPMDVGWALVDASDDIALKPAVIEEPSGYRFFRFDSKDVSDFMERVTTVQRLAFRSGLERKEVIRRLKVAHVHPAMSFRDVGIDIYRTGDLPASLRA